MEQSTQISVQYTNISARGQHIRCILDLVMVNRMQLKMVRAALGWGVRELAAQSGVAANTISRYENGADAYGETLTKLRRTLESAGIVFIDEDEHGGPGVRLAKKKE